MLYEDRHPRPMPPQSPPRAKTERKIRGERALSPRRLICDPLHAGKRHDDAPGAPECAQMSSALGPGGYLYESREIRNTACKDPSHA
eukprot:CAMPEP_0198560414 /NCGR_PEP_ID=MMETSP1462-20131121/93915_1 /TAXON_ID=1333877 /ORGANISM="Brandtodinium nutriculum, Strain RCC3387" /LENGTH=86 /DNA_ID=CAMNT_0044291279 /DNA_START=114 /DNA_END=370 /DNA_ORIENTATION=-